nr:hypothetical protein [Nocardia rhamnosiphila]
MHHAYHHISVPNLRPHGRGHERDHHGHGFPCPATVRFGATATAFTLDSPARITAIAPGGSTGTAAVTVTTARGTSNLRHADHRGGPAGSAGTVPVTVMGSGRSSNGLGYTYM